MQLVENNERLNETPSSVTFKDRLPYVRPQRRCVCVPVSLCVFSSIHAVCFFVALLQACLTLCRDGAGYSAPVRQPRTNFRTQGRSLREQQYAAADAAAATAVAAAQVSAPADGARSRK